MKNPIVALSLCVLLCASTIAASGESMKHERIIDGNVNPADVPEWVKLDELMKGYQGELSKHVEPGIHQSLLKVMQDAAWVRGVEFALASTRNRLACQELKYTGSVNRPRHKGDLDSNLRKIYDGFLQSISHESKQVLMEYLDAEVTPVIVFRVPAQEKERNGDTAKYLAHLDRICDESYEGRLEISREKIMDVPNGEVFSIRRRIR